MNGAIAKRMFDEKSICICGHPYENRFHMILDCISNSDLRQYCIKRLMDIIIPKYGNRITKEMIVDRTAFTHLVVDPSWFRKDIGADNKGLPNIFTKETADQLEAVGRTFCYQIYRRRFDILSEVDTDSDTDTDDSYSLQDSTDSSSEDSSDWSDNS